MLCQVVVTSTQRRSVIGVDASLRVDGALCQRRTTRTVRRTARPTLDALWHDRLSHGCRHQSQLTVNAYRSPLVTVKRSRRGPTSVGSVALSPQWTIAPGARESVVTGVASLVP